MLNVSARARLLGLCIVLALTVPLQASPPATFDYRPTDVGATVDTESTGKGNAINDVMFVGEFRGGQRVDIQRPVILFELDVLPEGHRIESATLRVRVHNKAGDPEAVNLYHLPKTSASKLEPAMHEAEGKLVHEGIIPSGTEPNTWHTADVTQAIQTIYDAAEDQAVAAFRAQLEPETGAGATTRYSLGNRRWLPETHPNHHLLPQLVIEVVAD